jgi:hypothetical protein
MLKPRKMPPLGTPPRLMLLDHLDENGEPRAALIRPGRMPIVFPNLAHAVDALRQDLAR